MRISASRWNAAVVILVGLAAILLIICSAVWLIQWSLLKADLQALQSRNLPTNAAELGAYYRIPDGERDTTELWLKAIQAAANVYERGTSLPVFESGAAPLPPPGEPWADLAASESFLAESQDAMDAIHRAAGEQGCIRFPFDPAAGINTILPDVLEQRNVARLLVLQTYVRAHRGEQTQALASLLDLFQMVRALRVAPVMISQLVRYAIFSSGCDAVQALLSNTDWSDEQLTLLQTAVHSLHFRQEAQMALSGEWAFMLDGINQLPFRVLNVWETRKMLRVSEGYRQALSRTSWQEVFQDQENLQTEFRLRREIPLLISQECNADYLLDVLEGFINAPAQAEAKQRSLLTLINCQRFQRQQGMSPQSLSEIVAFFPEDNSRFPEMSLDPYVDQSLKFLANEREIKIYSVGKNLIDDGGEIEQQADGQLLDVGYRLIKPVR